MIQTLTHIALHFIVPGIYAKIFFKQQQLKSWVIMMSTMIVDLDHLLATPVFDPNRCSIGFHPLHSYLAIILYLCLLSIKKTRVIAIGLLIHMGVDFTDCI
ncbi:conserved hypothetical protein, membrane [Candidatus Magnetomorum sp. HK-1]|nr:conserved hypothetical protein, membrane [Candidatus Magnetomorum sp. HK-1]